jgi:hypothetical protein
MRSTATRCIGSVSCPRFWLGASVERKRRFADTGFATYQIVENTSRRACRRRCNLLVRISLNFSLAIVCGRSTFAMLACSRHLSEFLPRPFSPDGRGFLFAGL